MNKSSQAWRESSKDVKRCAMCRCNQCKCEVDEVETGRDRPSTTVKEVLVRSKPRCQVGDTTPPSATRWTKSFISLENVMSRNKFKPGV